MKKKLIFIISVILAAGLIFAGCSDNKNETKSSDKPKSTSEAKSAGQTQSSGVVEGKYSSSVGDIELKKDGTFTLVGANAAEHMNLNGKYTLNNNVLEFNVLQNEGEEVGVKLQATFENDTITVVGNPPYKKVK